MNPKFIDVMVVQKTSFRSCFKFGTFSTNATKREQIAYERKAKWKT